MQIHCNYHGIKGFVKTYNYGLKWLHMIIDKAKHKARVLAFWSKHGLQATIDAFPVKRSTLFYWKSKIKAGQGKIESLNNQSRALQAKRKRLWPEPAIAEIKRLRWEHPNLSKDKIYPLLLKYRKANSRDRNRYATQMSPNNAY